MSRKDELCIAIPLVLDGQGDYRFDPHQSELFASQGDAERAHPATATGPMSTWGFFPVKDQRL